MPLPYDPSAVPAPVSAAAARLPYQPDAVADNTPVAPTTNTVIAPSGNSGGFDWSSARIVAGAPTTAAPVAAAPGSDENFALDSGKTLAGGALEGAGNAARGLGELARLGGAGVASVVNSIFGTDKDSVYYLRATNPLAEGDGGIPVADKAEGAGKDLLDSRSDAAKQAVADSTPTGNIFKGEFDLGKNPTLKGYAYQLENLVGNLAPLVVATALTGGSAAVGAVGGASLGAGQGAAQVKAWFDGQSYSDLKEHSKVFSDLVAGGMDQSAAKEETLQRTLSVAVPMTAAVGLLGGAAVSKTLGALGTKAVAAGVRGPIARTAIGAGIGATEGATVGVAQNTATNVGTNIGAGADIAPGQGSGAMAAIGALGGGMMGGATAAFARGPLERAAAASNPGSDLTAPPVVPPVVPGAPGGPALLPPLERAAHDALDQPQGTSTLLDADGNIVPSDASIRPAADPAAAANADLAARLRANATRLGSTGGEANKEQARMLMARADKLDDAAGAPTAAEAGDVAAQSTEDAKRVDPTAISFTDDGRPTHSSLTSFIAAMPPDDQSQLHANGNPTKLAENRMIGAALVHGYGDDPAFVALRSQAITPQARNVIAGVAAAASPMARLDDVGPFDVRPAVRQAAQMAVQASNSGVRLLTLAKSPDVDPAVRPILQFMADNATSQKRIAAGLTNLAEGVHTEANRSPEEVKRETADQQAALGVGDDARPSGDEGAPAKEAAAPSPPDEPASELQSAGSDVSASPDRDTAGASDAGDTASSGPLDRAVALRDKVPATITNPATRDAIASKYAEAEQVKPHFDSALRAIADEHGVDVKIPTGLKGMDRAAEKIANDYGGDASRIKDLVRGTIVVKDASQVPAVMKSIRDRFGDPTNVRNALAPGAPTFSESGYRDAKLNVSIDGHLAEIQINTAGMLAAKKMGHPFYVQREALRRTVGDRPATPEEAALRQELLAKERVPYAALATEGDASAISARQVASGKIAPFRMNDTPENGRGGDESQAVQTKLGASETGTPSTSAKVVPAGKEAGSEGTNESLSMTTPFDNTVHPAADDEKPSALFARDTAGHFTSLDVDSPEGGLGLHRDTAQRVVDDISSKWADKPDTVVVGSYDDLPEAIRHDHADQGGQTGEVQGAFHGGKLYLVADAHTTRAQLETTLFHEAWGHFGLRSAFGESMGKSMAQIFDRIGGMADLIKMGDRLGIDLRGKRDAVTEAQRIDPRYTDNAIKRTMVEELVAHATEKGLPALGGRIKEMLGAIRNWLRKTGFATLAKFNDSDLAHLVKQARDSVRLGEKGDLFVGDQEKIDRARGVSESDRILADAINNGDTGTYFRKGPKTKAQGPQEKNMPAWMRKLSPDEKATLKKAGVWVEKKPLKQRFDEMRQEAGLKLVQGVVDQYRPILAKIGEYPYQLLRMAGSSAGSLEASLRWGHVKLNDAGALEIKKGTKGLLETLKPLHGETDRFLSWVAGNRAERLLGEGRENNFDPKDIAFLKKLNGDLGPDDKFAGQGNRTDVYRQVLKGWNEYSKAIMDVAEKSGVVGATSRAAWENEFYVPFYREMEDKAPIPGNVSGMVNQKGVKRLKGGLADLHDLLANSLGNWANLLDSSMRNNAARETLTQAERLGIAAKLTAAEKGSVYFLHDGQPRHYMITDPLIMDAIASLGPSPNLGPVMKGLSWFKHALTVGTTASPVFRIRHTVREQITAMAANPTSYNFVKNWIDGFKYSSKDNPQFGQMEAGGAFMRMGQSLDGDRAGHVKAMIAETVQKSKLDSPQAVYRKAYNWWKEVGERSDSITRANLYRQEYARQIAAGETPDMAHFRASYTARDVMDFGLHGTFASVKILTQMVPFMNARLQGMYKLGRGAVEGPASGKVMGVNKRFAAVIGGVTMATIALSLLNRNDKEIQNLPDSDHNNNWIVRLPGASDILRIPKPFEVGALATVIDRGLKVVLNGFQPADRDEFVHQLWPVIGSQLAMNPVPQAVWPLVQLWANKDEFRGSQIESARDLKLTTDQRIGPNTSATAQAIGKGMAAVLPSAVALSPEQIDFLVNSYLGWMGSHAIATADLAVRPMMNLPSKPAARIDDYFLIGDFVHQLPSDQSKFVNTFYDHMAKVQQQMDDVRMFNQTGQPGKAREMLSENKDLPQVAGTYAAISSAIGKINLEARLIEAMPDSKITPDARRAKLDAFAQQKNALAERAETMRAAKMNR